MSEKDITRKWYAVHTKPHKEAVAEQNLRNQSFEVFLPKIERTIRHARKFQTVKRPLFPRYLFVSLDLQHDPWRSVNGTRGVAHLIMMGERPQVAPDQLIDMLRGSIEGDVINFASVLKLGAKSRVMSGPFSEFIGELKEIDASGRVLLLLDIMGRKVPLWSHQNDISQNL